MNFTRWPDKAPSESVIVSFDFIAVAASVSAPSVTAYVHWYAQTLDANPSAILVGSPTVSGTVVYQTCAGGLDLNDYAINCTVTSSTGEVLMIPAILPVRLRN